MRISDWSSDVCSSDLVDRAFGHELFEHDAVLAHLAGRDLDRRDAFTDAAVAGDVVGAGRLLDEPRPREGERADVRDRFIDFPDRSEEHTSELQSLMRISYAVFCLKKNTITKSAYSYITLI